MRSCFLNERKMVLWSVPKITKAYYNTILSSFKMHIAQTTLDQSKYAYDDIPDIIAGTVYFSSVQ